MAHKQPRAAAGSSHGFILPQTSNLSTPEEATTFPIVTKSTIARQHNSGNISPFSRLSANQSVQIQTDCPSPQTKEPKSSENFAHSTIPGSTPGSFIVNINIRPTEIPRTVSSPTSSSSLFLTTSARPSNSSSFYNHHNHLHQQRQQQLQQHHHQTNQTFTTLQQYTKNPAHTGQTKWSSGNTITVSLPLQRTGDLAETLKEEPTTSGMYTDMDAYNNNSNLDAYNNNNLRINHNNRTLFDLNQTDSEFDPPSSIVNHGKLPSFSNWTAQLLHGPTLEEVTPASPDASYNSANTSRSSSCSSGFEEDEGDTPHFTELGLATLGFDEADTDPMMLPTWHLEQFSADEMRHLQKCFISGDCMGNDISMMKTEPIDQGYTENNGFMTNDFAFSSDIISDFSDSEGYESSYEQHPSCSSSSPSVPTHGYYNEPPPLLQMADATFRQITYPASSSSITYTSGHNDSHSSPDSDEGFVDEPHAIPENLPNFEKIQYQSSNEPEKHQQANRRSPSNSPGEKRKAPSSPQITDKERRKPGRKPGQVSNVLHLWEFMRDLLHSPDSKGIIEWISKPEGVFRVVNSTEVAKLWGKKKKNKKEMTYEKLSRSLRYSRFEGYFSDLPKDKNYPKKLCFKFGPKSRDWM